MTPNLVDHLFVILLALVFPILDYRFIRERVERIRAGETALRMALYRRIVFEQWIGAFIVIVAWFAFGRGVVALGLVPQAGVLVWTGYGLTALICALLLFQARSVVGNPKAQAAVRDSLGWFALILPHTLRERRRFDLVSLTAGICEEVVFRGYLTAYLVALLGVPFWAGLVLSSLLFGVAHSYQGPKGATRAGAAGLVFALLYGLTGSLWTPILAHALMDLTSGRIAFASLSDGCPENTSPQLAA